MIPGPWVALVLGLAVYRLVRLAGWDDFPWALKARAWVTGEYVSRGPHVDGTHYVHRRPTVKHFLACPFCVGFWLSVLVYVAWLELPTATLYTCAPFALSAFAGLVAKNLDP